MAHPPEAVFEFLSDLRNHWRLEPHFLELEHMDPDGGVVRVRGPFGLSRVARTRVVSAEHPHLLRGAADIGRGTRGAVRWEVDEAPGGSRVRFTAAVERAAPVDRVVLACGGRWWLSRIVAGAVGRLGAVLDAQPHRSPG